MLLSEDIFGGRNSEEKDSRFEGGFGIYDDRSRGVHGEQSISPRSGKLAPRKLEAFHQSG